MLVILNDDKSVNCVLAAPEDIDTIHFDPELGMSIVEMDDFKGTCDSFDYFDYYVINGHWVHSDDVEGE